MTTIYEISTQVNTIVETFVKENSQYVSADKVNLDSRCGSLYVGKNFIAVPSFSNGRLRYYGGFEYVDNSDITHMGEYVIYNDNSERVYDAIEFFNNYHNETTG